MIVYAKIVGHWKSNSELPNVYIVEGIDIRDYEFEGCGEYVVKTKDKQNEN